MDDPSLNNQDLLDELAALADKFKHEAVAARVAKLLAQPGQLDQLHKARLLLIKGCSEFALLRYWQADESLQEALQTFTEKDLHREEVNCRIELAKVTRRNSNHQRSLVQLEICERLIVGQDWPVERAILDCERALIGIHSKSREQDCEGLRQGIDELEQAGEANLAIRYKANLAFAYSLSGQPQACSLLIDKLKPQLEQLGDLRNLSKLTNTQAVVYWRDGDLSSARKCFEQAVQYESQQNHKSNLAALSNNLALLDLDQQNLAGCRKHCNRALHYLSVAQVDDYLPDIYMIQAFCALLESNWEEAANLAQLAWTETRDLTDMDGQLVRYYVAICLLGTNDCAGAIEHWQAKPQLNDSWEIERELRWFNRSLNHLLDKLLTADADEMQAARGLALTWRDELAAMQLEAVS